MWQHSNGQFFWFVKRSPKSRLPFEILQLLKAWHLNSYILKHVQAKHVGPQFEASQLQQVPYIWTFKMQTFKDVNVCSINIRQAWNCSLSSISYCWQSFSSTISHFLSLLVSNSSRLACQLLYYTTVLFKVVYYEIKNVFFIFWLFFMYYLCGKYYKPFIGQYYIANCVSWVPRLTLLDWQMHSQNRT